MIGNAGIIAVFFFNQGVFSPVQAAGWEECRVTREYVTTLEFLKNEKSLAVNDEEAKKIAEKVSSHCTDSARKFIRVIQLLVNAGFTGRNSLDKAIELSGWKTENVDAFEDLFLAAFARDGLDLPMGDALEMSYSLSKDTKSNPRMVQSAFVRIVDFCVGSDKFQLPKHQCANVVRDLCLVGQKFESDLSEPFIELVSFLTKEQPNGPGRSMLEAYQISVEVLKAGPLSARNFIQAYQYAMDSSGLKYSDVQAMEFAKSLAKSSFKEIPQENQKKKDN